MIDVTLASVVISSSDESMLPMEEESGREEEDEKESLVSDQSVPFSNYDHG
jgi:hypothetical protein